MVAHGAKLPVPARPASDDLQRRRRHLAPEGGVVAVEDPRNDRRAHGHLLIANWINAIYQSTPYDLGRLKFPNSQGNSGASS